LSIIPFSFGQWMRVRLLFMIVLGAATLGLSIIRVLGRLVDNYV